MDEPEWTEPAEYTHDNIKNKVLNKPGMYYLTREVWGQGQKVFYIGQTDNLQRTLEGHLQPSEPNPVIKDKIKFKSKLRIRYSDATEKERKHELKNLILEHSPIGNV